MCGIFGMWHRDGSAVSLSLVREATDLLRHRGPDDEGYLLFHTQTQRALSCAGRDTDERLRLPELPQTNEAQFDFALGFRRLSIIDLSPGGHQPMASHDGRFWVVLNGEIYNYVELRKELEALGHHFRSLSDTEILLAAFLQWGPAALSRLVGMFAFGILDSRTRTLLLGRDPFGIKPLYYIRNEKAFAFASEIPPLLKAPGVSRAVNPERLYLYLRYALMDYGADTMFADVHQLPAGHYMEIRLDDSGAAPAVCYWQIDLSARLSLSPEDAADRLQDLFLASVKLHLRSDVTIGAALSGGIDSSSIVSAIRHLQAENVALQAFSFIADDPALNEESWIDIAGRAVNAVQHKVWVKTDELAADMERLIHLHAEPFLSTHVNAQYWVCKMAHEAGIKVMLNGQGADEILGGYSGYLSARLASLVRQRRGCEAVRLVREGLRREDHVRFWLQVGRYLLPPSVHPLAHGILQRLGEQRSWLNTDWFEKRGAVSDPHAQSRGTDVLRSVLGQAVTMTSLPVFLRYEDRNSMSNSIESRVPFLTPDLVSFVLALPEEFIIDRSGVSKSVMRRAMAGIVPQAILNRRDKIGFQTPERRWLMILAPWVDQTLNSTTATRIPALNSGVMVREWEAVRNGRKRFNLRIWRWVNLIRWADSFGVVME